MTAAAADATGRPAPTTLAQIPARMWLVLLMVQLCSILFGMTITVANVVLPQIKGTLSATQDQIALVVTFNLVATAVATPLTGWLAARLGWRNLMVGSVAGFTGFSLLCGFAGSVETLVLYRTGQGAFGAPIMPMGQAILLATFPRALHPTVIMMWGIGGVLGPTLGPLLGGAISEAYGWRGAFFMVVPAGILATFIAWIALERHQERGFTRFACTGFLALAALISAAQLMLDRGLRLGWFESTEILVEATIVLVALWVFVVHSATARRPFLDPRMLLDRNFSVGLVIVLVMGALSFTLMVLFPAMLSELRGYPDDVIGMLLAGRGLGNWISFAIVVPFTKWDARLALAVGLLAQALSGWWMASLDINLTDFDIFWSNVLQGFGFGLAYTPMTVLTFATLNPAYTTDGTAVYHLLRNFGSSLFISVSLTLVVHSTATNQANLTALLTPFNEALSYPALLGAWDPENAIGLMAIAGEVRRQAAMIGYLNAFQLFALISALAIPFVWLFRVPGRRG